MPPFEPFHAARPRRFRQSSAPKTPEPSMEGPAEEEYHPPSPPRPRFRLRRRAASQISAPTQHFLASVAAADVPVPSIEEPHVYDDDDDEEMLNIAYPSIPQLDRIEPDNAVRGRAFSPPKTPAPGLAPSLSPKQFPDWSIEGALSSLESSPEYESSRPSTARSTQTSSSLFSRFSFNSEELSQCASPENEQNDRFGHFLLPQDADKTIKPSGPARHARLRKAPWTKAMSQHVWSTYLMYLQDPKVTPFRTGKSGIPPSGVCMRVAREAKRSWKGSRLLTGKVDDKSGSTTPTGESCGPYMEWPHTCAATRGHLRELCKAHSGTTTRNLQNLSSSPTPFGKSVNRFWTRRSVPARSPSVFSGSDMAMSLTVCTSDSMQRQGPLAQLTSSQSEAQSVDLRPPMAEGRAEFSFAGLTEPPRGRLGSPFMARSYGPSSSNAWTDSFSFSPEGHRQNRTVGTRRGLGSPVRIDQSRSSTQKRRSRQSVLETRRSKRPSLGSDFWTDPSSNEVAESATSPKFIKFSSTDSSHRDNPFVPRTNIQELFSAPSAGPSLPSTTGGGLISSHTVPARLGSPFSAKASSHSFPNRHSSASSFDFGSAMRPFATVHQTGFGPGAPSGPGEDDKSASSSSSSVKTSLANRLAYIDERLKNFRRRGASERRSKSPCP